LCAKDASTQAKSPQVGRNIPAFPARGKINIRMEL
jgi:hypothetical protein